jgi:serine/threonine protein kinase
VFSVKRHTDNKKFAVKVYDTKKIFNEKHSYWILYEIMILRDMNTSLNTNCLKLCRIYEGLSYVYCVTELYKGGELLDAMVREGSLSEYMSLRILKALLTGLCYLEKQGIVHRDIKPQNIVLRGKKKIDDIVIVDFGFAIKLEDIDPKNKQLAYCVGTPGYIAPEMIGYRDYGTKADVFSAGATLYLMMHYSPAFFAKNKEDVIR